MPKRLTEQEKQDRVQYCTEYYQRLIREPYFELPLSRKERCHNDYILSRTLSEEQYNHIKEIRRDRQISDRNREVPNAARQKYKKDRLLIKLIEEGAELYG